MSALDPMAAGEAPRPHLAYLSAAQRVFAVRASLQQAWDSMSVLPDSTGFPLQAYQAFGSLGRLLFA